MYLYETHLHTSPVSRCAIATVRENLEYYKSIGYSGVFITNHHNHFINGSLTEDDVAQTVAVAEEAFAVIKANQD